MVGTTSEGRSHGQMRPLRRMIVAATLLALVAGALFGAWRVADAAPEASKAPVVSLAELHEMIFVWASGTPQVQALAQQRCADMQLTAPQCANISASVRQTWLDLLARDPAALGRVGARPNLAARRQILLGLGARLEAALPGRVPQVLLATGATYAQIRDPQFPRQAARQIGRPVPIGGVRYVWATSYSQPNLPPGMTTNGSLYAALPDLYLSMANVGTGANIPAIYQPYYWPGAKTTHWAVTVSNLFKTANAYNVLITDVGPWNEDDNWWDPNGTSATLPTNCPVAPTLVAPDATQNPLVNGICPNGRTLRRLYYYLLYQHAGLPFFTTAAYQPSGAFADGTSWPLTLPTLCAETTVASINNDGITCTGKPSGSYNANHGAWLRDGTNDSPILNQSSIDLSPAVDTALGWTYPSSGLVQVNVAGLP